MFIPSDELRMPIVIMLLQASMKQCNSLFPGRTTLQVRFTCQNLERWYNLDALLVMCKGKPHADK